MTLRGVLRRQIFQSSDRFYTVAVLETHPDSREETLAGDLGGCEVGDTVEVEGVRVHHPKYGTRVQKLMVRWIPPITAAGTRRFLSGGQIPGIGAKLAERIVEAFGADTCEVLDRHPERLGEVEGIGAGRAKVLAEAWRECRGRFEETAFLAGLGLGPVLSSRVREVYGAKAAKEVKADPYGLVLKVEGIGFQRADEIARGLDIPAHAPARIGAGLGHVLNESRDQGHTYVLRAELVEKASELLGLPPGPVQDRLGESIDEGALRVDALDDGEAVFLPQMQDVEKEVACELRDRLATSTAWTVEPAQALRWVEPRLGFKLTDDQRRALRTLFEHPVSVLTGGPGVGKTTIVRALSEVYESRGRSVALAAPTGRAARRLEEACDRDARTLHRLMRYMPQLHKFEHDRSNPLAVDVLLIDEASMIDLPLMRSVLRALPKTSRLVLVGDADQLPSVGPGDVLRSVVDSGEVPVARLTRILRQKEGSSIVQAAHSVLGGTPPSFQKQRGEGAFFAKQDDPRAAQKTILDLVERRLPDHYGLDPRRDVQVLTPMHRGPLGTLELNERIKARLNPTGEESFGAGDRVLQTRNDYELEVFNGEIGTVVGMNDGRVQVDFEGRRVDYSVTQKGNLQLAYAITVHKSQGCEFSAVILVMSTQHFRMLRRNLLYTAITRARRVLVVVGSDRALHAAVEVGTVERRRSLLQRRLIEGVERTIVQRGEP